MKFLVKVMSKGQAKNVNCSRRKVTLNNSEIIKRKKKKLFRVGLKKVYIP